MSEQPVLDVPRLDPAKFRDPLVTAKGETRASVRLRKLDTLWINTGTLCNIECANCYIESGPVNDRLTYITAGEVASFLDETEALALGTREIGFTGGEPFMNPDMCVMIEEALSRGFEVLVLTNAMKPMMRPLVQADLLAIKDKYAARLTLRVSLDHYTEALHQVERGPESWAPTMDGLRWLASHGFRINVAGRTCWGENEAKSRAGYRALFAKECVPLDTDDPSTLVLFPEMDASVDVAEITTNCWDILDVDPNTMMCASSRMVVKRKGAAAPAVVACTLLPYDRQFELGATLAESQSPVRLNHPHCAKFCVLGGGSCSVAD